ncbi:MAG: 4Fe-4S binding protein [Desulfitobacterium sp.]|nr:4Fe-4S binding protein [Desulfitobacterium sp.]
MSAFILDKLCRGCQRCVRACLQDAIKMTASVAFVDSEKCIECEECMEVCMHGAITFVEGAKVAYGK